jgi:hypothetical protein
MNDKILLIEDFKKIMEQKHLRRENLRIAVMEEQLNEVYTKTYVILTIPKNKHTIMECLLGKGIYVTMFLHDKDNTDYTQSRELYKQAKEKAEKHFGDIIEGRWTDDK